MSAIIDELPGEVRAALDADLGAAERVFGSAAPARLREARTNFFWCLGFVLLALLVLAVAPAWAMVFPLVPAGSAALVALVARVRAAECRPELAVLCANGFVYRDAEDSVIVFRFDRIATVRQDLRVQIGGLRSGQRHRYTVTTRRGTTYVFDDRLADVTDLGDAVARRVAQRLLPTAVRALQHNRTVAVRPFELSRRGIAIDGRRLDWAQGARVSVFNGQVTVAAGGRTWATVAARDVDNLYLLLTLADALT
jgi:hypothetical protein